MVKIDAERLMEGLDGAAEFDEASRKIFLGNLQIILIGEIADPLNAVGSGAVGTSEFGAGEVASLVEGVGCEVCGVGGAMATQE